MDELDHGCMPGILLFRGYGMRRMNDSPSFSTREKAVEFLVTAQKIWVYYMHLLTYIILISKEHGYNSHWHLGAPINMSDAEYTHRVTKDACYGGGQSLRRLMDHGVYTNSMDFLCANFISKYTRRLLLSFRDNRVYLTMWSVPKEMPGQDELGDQFTRMYLAEYGLSKDP
ncbi:hypothetical protein B0H11DRAFT_2235291 [Mycena galericulata]|nr:hypothetical protein B0H11DRAFT_2235291 [Mycena galericulata]